MLSEILEKHLREIQAQSVPKPVQAPTFAAPTTGFWAPSDKQVKYFKALVEGKQLTPEQRAQLMSGLAVLDCRSITSSIQWLVGLPWTPPRPARPNVVSNTNVGKIQEGRYAIAHPADQTLHFYEVRKPVEGKWAGFVFMSELSGENHIPMKDRVARDVVYAEIAKDVTGSLKLYGQKIGRCGHCSKQLTDEVSREFGIGPVCRKALGL